MKTTTVFAQFVARGADAGVVMVEQAAKNSVLTNAYTNAKREFKTDGAGRAILQLKGEQLRQLAFSSGIHDLGSFVAAASAAANAGHLQAELTVDIRKVGDEYTERGTGQVRKYGYDEFNQPKAGAQDWVNVQVNKLIIPTVYTEAYTNTILTAGANRVLDMFDKPVSRVQQATTSRRAVAAGTFEDHSDMSGGDDNANDGGDQGAEEAGANAGNDGKPETTATPKGNAKK